MTTGDAQPPELISRTWVNDRLVLERGEPVDDPLTEYDEFARYAAEKWNNLKITSTMVAYAIEVVMQWPKLRSRMAWLTSPEAERAIANLLDCYPATGDHTGWSSQEQADLIIKLIREKTQ